uniref:Uncharacterized protein n=1 Tax=viral metagenome TaxID=1070528 RepID=A0A6M3KB30_9ZZZZ
MKYFLTNTGYSFSSQIARVSTTINIATDDYVADPPAGKILWTESVSVEKNIFYAPGDWYVDGKAELTQKCQAIINSFIANMTHIASVTGFTDTDALIADIILTVEGGLV